ncbi:MAG: GAF domain-containing protein [Candidatus Omnitrophica bacterium]|nr:GAF domain-containing protein [Candidatus Omnitrophota bacterium]
MKTTLTNDRQIFDDLIRHESLRKLRVTFDFLLGQPVWWVSYKLNGNSKSLRHSIESSYDIWHDPRAKTFRYAPQIFYGIKRRVRETRPFRFNAPSDVPNFCVPLALQDRVIGYFVLSGIRKDVRQEVLNLLSGHIQVVLDNCAKKEELDRLTATIRPRAIALSTVHTVHRIVNSTLNLDELISRLAHLISQVLRANRCAIYLVDKSGPCLACKALVGYSKGKNKDHHAPKFMENTVAKTARIILRKSLMCIPLIDEDVIGVVTVHAKKDKKDFTYFDQEILTTLAEEAVIAIKNAQLYEEQKRVTLGTIQSLADILGTRVPNGASPQLFLRVALKIAAAMHLSEEETQALHYATLLKDTAKVGIPDDILRKPTKLTGEEYRLIREHPIKGAKIVQSFESLKPVVPIILYSREKYDGTGYPKGLKGDKIPIGARILSLINAFEALIVGRPYRDRFSLKEAFSEISKNSGTQFDPKVVEVFLRVVKTEDFRRGLRHEK